MLPTVWSDAAAWGLLLVDIARHVANAVGKESQSDPSIVLSRIRAGMNAEWDRFTSEAPGEFIDSE